MLLRILHFLFGHEPARSETNAEDLTVTHVCICGKRWTEDISDNYGDAA